MFTFITKKGATATVHCTLCKMMAIKQDAFKNINVFDVNSQRDKVGTNSYEIKVDFQFCFLFPKTFVLKKETTKL